MKTLFILTKSLILIALLSFQSAYGNDPASTKININSANATEIANVLKGVGPDKAARIVKYRETFGAYSSIDELTEVKGIGPSTVDKNRDIIKIVD